nr:DUF4229 domain-containing protein [Cellulomonas sp. RIT-PI-Y]
MIYSLLRLALFAVCTVALAFAGMGWLFAVILGAVLAGVLSYLVLPGPRDRAAQWLQARSERRGDRPRLSRRAQEDAAVEDAAVDSAAVDHAAVDESVVEEGEADRAQSARPSPNSTP